LKAAFNLFVKVEPPPPVRGAYVEPSAGRSPRPRRSPPRPHEPRAHRARVSSLHICGGRGSIVARLAPRKRVNGNALNANRVSAWCGAFQVFAPSRPQPPGNVDLNRCGHHSQ
jgi:hypothetical protein